MKSFNCELEQGDSTMYGVVVKTTRLPGDRKVRVNVKPENARFPRVVYLQAAGVTTVYNH